MKFQARIPEVASAGTLPPSVSPFMEQDLRVESREPCTPTLTVGSSGKPHYERLNACTGTSGAGNCPARTGVFQYFSRLGQVGVDFHLVSLLSYIVDIWRLVG